MNARNKLNVAFVNGSLVVAALIAATFGSWLVFGIAAGALLTGNVIAGDIRLRRRK